MITQLLVILGALLLLGAAYAAIRYRSSIGEFFANTVTIKSIPITPYGRATRLADASFTAKYLICKKGTDASHIDICTASDKPLGIVPDMTPTTDQAASDLTYPLPVYFLGLNQDTERVIASAAISIDDMIVPAAAGQVKTLPGSGGGTTYIIGKALTAALAAGDMVEIVPCFPYIVTIAT